MPIGTDFAVDISNNITHVANTTVYTVLELHSWLQDLADNAAPAGDDNISILSPNPSKLDGPRDALTASKLNLLTTFNIDASAARFINFGSIKQASGNTLFSGLKTIGGIVAASPVYVVQNGAKLTKFWADGHIQILVLAKTGGNLINAGDVTAYSRKWGQTYSHFDVNLAAGGETAAALGTAIDSNIVLSLVNAIALSSKVAISLGSITRDLNNGNGSKTYLGEITLTNGATLQEAYQYMQAICEESSAYIFGAVEGWKFRKLHSSYSENTGAPCGSFAGGTYFLARGWFITGVLSAESTKYQLIADDGTTQNPPNIVAITIGGLIAGDRVAVGRDAGSDFVIDEYQLDAGNNIGEDTIVIKTIDIKADTPATGVIRIGNERYTYTGWSAKTFTGVSPVLSANYPVDTDAWVPFIDEDIVGTSKSVEFKFNAGFTARLKVRQGSGGTPIQPFETTFSVGSSGGGTNAVRNSDV